MQNATLAGHLTANAHARCRACCPVPTLPTSLDNHLLNANTARCHAKAYTAHAQFRGSLPTSLDNPLLNTNAAQCQRCPMPGLLPMHTANACCSHSLLSSLLNADAAYCLRCPCLLPTLIAQAHFRGSLPTLLDNHAAQCHSAQCLRCSLSTLTAQRFSMSMLLHANAAC